LVDEVVIDDILADCTISVAAPPLSTRWSNACGMCWSASRNGVVATVAGETVLARMLVEE
jgi:hypothetical protein